MNCEICENKFEKNILYENDKIIIMVAPDTATSGHLQIYPKKHYQILEQVPAELLAYMGVAANKLSIVLFELLKVHGTNIIIQNGVPAGQTSPHFCINVIPRRTDDGLKLDWDLKQAAPEALENIQRIIEEGMNAPEPQIVSEESTETSDEKEHELKEPSSEESPEETSNSDKPKKKSTNYWLKSLERIP